MFSLLAAHLAHRACSREVFAALEASEACLSQISFASRAIEWASSATIHARSSRSDFSSEISE